MEIHRSSAEGIEQQERRNTEAKWDKLHYGGFNAVVDDQVMVKKRKKKGSLSTTLLKVRYPPKLYRRAVLNDKKMEKSSFFILRP